MRPSLLPFVVAAFVALAAPQGVAQAQDAAGRPAESVCLGFAFGAFTPRLDWEKAGHSPIRAGSVQRAPDGRDWASDQALPNDSSLYLFPAWWPVGIWVELSSRAPAPGDTVDGRATALVARGNIAPPVARVRAWRIPCGGSPSTRSPAPAADTAPQRARPRG